jgi:hypothetical protein
MIWSVLLPAARSNGVSSPFPQAFHNAWNLPSPIDSGVCVLRFVGEGCLDFRITHPGFLQLDR